MSDTEPITCGACGAPLPPVAATASVQCSFCGAASKPAPRVVQEVVDRVVVVPAAGAEPASGLHCPRCGDSFREGRAGEHRVRSCPRCGGDYLEPGGVAALAVANGGASILKTKASLVLLVGPYPYDPRIRLSCPVCKTMLGRVDIPDTGLSMDTCAEHGTFFGRGGLAAYVEWQAKIRSEMAGEVTDEDLDAAGVGGGILGWFRKRS